jgi:hypothetical protein
MFKALLKEAFMLKKRYLVAVAAFAVFLAGCQSGAVPITPNLIKYVGPDNLEQFYFYLSKDVILERQEEYQDSVRFQNGVAIPINRDISESILIKKSTPGTAVKNMLTEAAYVTYTKSANTVQVTVVRDGEVVQAYEANEKNGVESIAKVSDANPTVTYQLLGVSFEEGEGREIGFAVLTSNNDGTFDMLLDDELSSSVLYEGKLYRVVYKGEERPYLMVRLGTGERDRSGSSRRVAGGHPAATRK